VDWEHEKGWVLSRVDVVRKTIEEVRDNLQHRFKKAYFVTGLASEKAKPLSLQSVLLLLVEAVLPCGIRLMPVIRRSARERERARVKK